MKNILVVIGTRPEAIKMAPVVSELNLLSGAINIEVLSTMQHTKLLDDAALDLGMKITSHLELITKNNHLAKYYPMLQEKLRLFISKKSPDLVLVHGDTATAACAAIISNLLQIPVGHIEAGLRSNNLNSPFPEEGNRRIIDSLSTLLFAPTESAAKNLGCSSNVFITGNTVLDSLRLTSQRIQDRNAEFEIVWNDRFRNLGDDFILVTQHRREAFGQKHQQVLAALKFLAKKGTKIIFPVHPNPAIHSAVYSELGNVENITLTEPLNYSDFIYILSKSRLVISDSGGLQEETASLGIPLLVTRQSTERDEATKSDLTQIVGHDTELIIKASNLILSRPRDLDQGKWRPSLFGDGFSAARIAEICDNFLSGSSDTDSILD